MKHIKGFDTLRAFAVFTVIIAHWGPHFDESQPALAFFKHYFVPDGMFGVDLFFVLSGFLITSILLKAKTTNTNQLTIIKNFMVRRALRIFPIYYLLVFILLLIGYQNVRNDAGYYLSYTTNILFYRCEMWGAIPHTWSLAVEEQFYLFWPWLIVCIKNRHLKYVFILAIIIGIVSGYVTSVVLHKGSRPILVFNCLGCFGMGAYYAYVLPDTRKKKQFERILLPIFIVCAAIYFHWLYAYDMFWVHTTFLFRMIDGVIALQMIVAVINNKKEWVRKYILENGILNYIGKISYGIYLYHYSLSQLYDEFLSDAAIRTLGHPEVIKNFYFGYCIKFALLFAVCALSYQFIERPFLSLKNRFTYQS